MFGTVVSNGGAERAPGLPRDRVSRPGKICLHQPRRMKKLLKAIGFRASASDRLVLRNFIIAVCVIASAFGLITLFFFWDGFWKPEVKRDSARLDAILANDKIDVVKVESGSSTNSFTGAEISALLASLQRTNRVGNIDWTKQPLQDVCFFNGTNAICHLSLGDDGAWGFGAYGFRLRPGTVQSR
jgi:hypothetical protein